MEISRERIPLRNAYKHVGQRACVRINSGTEQEVPGALPGLCRDWRPSPYVPRCRFTRKSSAFRSEPSLLNPCLQCPVRPFLNPC